jgi:hypothetical protein
MTMSRTSLGTSLLLFVPLAVLGLLLDGACAHWPFITTKKVIVGPGACTLTPSTDVPLSKSAGDQAMWKPSSQGTPLTIIFKRTGFPPTTAKPPFANMQQNENGDYYVPSGLGSGPINPQLTDSEIGGGLTYKYDQILAGIPCDGRIIIQR